MAHGDWFWHELYSPDPTGSQAFYGSLLGWETREMPMGEGMTYTLWRNAGKDSGGMMKLSGPEMEGVPPHWMVYVEVADIEETARKVPELGGKIVVAPMAVPDVGTFIVVADPQGAHISFIQPVPMPG